MKIVKRRPAAIRVEPETGQYWCALDKNNNQRKDIKLRNVLAVINGHVIYTNGDNRRECKVETFRLWAIASNAYPVKWYGDRLFIGERANRKLAMDMTETTPGDRP